jgi:hypothetical protein
MSEIIKAVLSKFNDDPWAFHEEWLKGHLEKCAEEGVHIFKYSTTERHDFKFCRRQWDYASPSRQGWEKKVAHEALWMGTGLHHALEMFYRREGVSAVEAWSDWIDSELVRLKEVVPESQWTTFEENTLNAASLGEGMLRNYEVWAEKADNSESIGFKRILSVEKEFQVPVRDDSGNIARFTDREGTIWEIHLVGRLDMLVEDFHDRIWIMDHKSSKDKLDPEHLLMDDQMTIYIWAVQQIIGRPIEGALYNVLRKKLPTIPKTLQAGGLSQDKSMDTTLEVYMEEIENQGLDPEKYVKMIDILSNKPNTFQQREKVRRTPYEIAVAGRMLLYEGIDMLNAPYIYPNPNWDCKWRCDYKELCLAQNRNDDVEWMLESMYQKSDRGSVYVRESTIE